MEQAAGQRIVALLVPALIGADDGAIDAGDIHVVDRGHHQMGALGLGDLSPLKVT
jgi:hypothetical protein